MNFVLAALVGMGEWALSSLLLVWLASAVHTWWPLVPEMGFGQASVLTAIVGLMCVVSFAAKRIMKEID